jgi:sterol desaturase/sphingolipid hydroxylase (fatty acid hydroxylase superfamily)
MIAEITLAKAGEIARVLFSIVSRYFLLAGIFYFVFYVWKNRKFWYAKIQQRYPENKHIRREISYSMLSVLIFGAIIILTIVAGQKGYTRVYNNIDQYGYFYFFFSIIVMIFLHDTYFYWTHRLMHWRPLFKIAHRTHHLSTNPTPFAAYAFHPIEAVVEVGIIPLIALIVPYHSIALIIFTIYSLLLNVIGHLGFEIFPKGFASHRLFKWHNTSTHHNMHHRLTKCNYGLYFNIWDRLMKTNHPEYEKSFDEMTEKREQGKLRPQAELEKIRG